MRKAAAYLVVIWLLAVVVLACGGCARIPYESVCRLNLGGTQGSGTLVGVDGDQAVILTCRHVAGSVGSTATITWPATGEVTHGEVIAVGAGDGYATDQALVQCGLPAGIEPVEIAEFDADNGPFVSVGYRGDQLYISTAQAGSDTAFINVLKLSAPYIGGMSGGACFDCYGRLVGIAVGTARNGGGYGIASNGENLHKLVRQYSK